MNEPGAHETIHWGIIGCGDVTEVKSGPGFQKARGSRLVAVMRRNGALALDYARRHGVARWYDDAQRLVADREVDAVYIATPPGSHLELARLVAAAGKPCYVEKPMARHAPECDAMIQAFAAAGQKLFVAYYRRAQPRFLKIKELLDQGAIGRLTGVGYRMASSTPVNADPAKGAWRVDASVSGGGLFLDVGSHVLDLLDFFVGPLQHVHGEAARCGEVGRTAPVSRAAGTTGERLGAEASPYPSAHGGNVEDSVAMTFRTADGVPGTATWNFASAVKEDMLQFTGTAGRISASVFGTEPVEAETSIGRDRLEFAPLPHVAQPLIQTVVDDLLGRGTCPSTAESARRTSVVMDQVLDAYYGGRSDAFWTRASSWPGVRSDRPTRNNPAEC